MKAFKVWLGRKHIDTVFYGDNGRTVSMKRYTTLRERTINRARRIRTLQRLTVWSAVVGFWVVVIRVFL